MSKLNKLSSTPLWEQLENILRERILSGEWVSGDLIPSENQLSNKYGISRMTVRSVLLRLTNEGIFYRVQGKGTFLSENKILATPLPYNGIREQLEMQGYKTTTTVLRNEQISVSHNIAKKLEIKTGELVYFIERLRSIKGEPFSLHRTYLKLKQQMNFTNEQLVNEQLCKIIEVEYNLYATKAEQTLEMVYSTKKLAEAFNLKELHPLLYLCDLRKINKDIFEYSEIYFKGDKIKLYFEFNELKK